MELGSILQWRRLLLVLAAGLAPALFAAAPASASQPLAAGAVFTETNTGGNGQPAGRHVDDRLGRWNAITKNDRFLYTTEPAGLVIGTPQILGYAIGHDGTLTPTGTGQTTPFNAVDVTISNDGRYLYVLNDGLLPFVTASAISEFSIDQQSGQLTWVGEVDLPGNATSGVAAW
jgi:hypothetical protein